MANRPSRLVVSIPTASSDGRFYGQYPHGDAPVGGGGLSGAAVINTQASGQLAGNIAITTSSVASASVGSSYSANVVASGGAGGNRWSLVGAQPNANLWVSVQTNSDGTGQIIGTPGAVETETVTVQVEDSAGAIAQATFTIGVGD